MLGFTRIFVRYQEGSVGTLESDRIEIEPNVPLGIPLPGPRLKRAAAQAGVDVFVNTRTDVVLRGLVPPERHVEETLSRARTYREAGCDGLFVPKLSDPSSIRAIVEGTELPVNVMLVPNLPSLAELARLGVRRVSAGAAIAQAVHGLTRRLAKQLLGDGGYGAMFEGAAAYPEMNALFTTAQ